MLAKNGGGAVRPNPQVGCVIVLAGQIIAEGWHRQFGQAHAEVNALAQLPEGTDLSQATVYVTLEPCSHFGKTPPCADLLISKQPGRVVVAMEDPHLLVAGKGIERLKAAGIAVEVGVEEQAARELNPHFITYHEDRRPYITLKWAMTADGFISRLPVPTNREDNLITGKAAQKVTHQLRAEHMAILVGRPTVEADNPLLNNRLVEGPSPLPLIIDRKGQLSANYRLTDGSIEVLIYNELKSEKQGLTEWVNVGGTNDFLKAVLDDLYARKIQSLMVEGGATLLNLFLAEGIWDELVIFVNPDLKFGHGIAAPSINLPKEGEKVGSDYLFRIKKKPVVG